MRTKKMVYTSLMTAIVFISTFSIKLPVYFTQGYIHLGDSMVFLSGLLLGPWYGAFAAGVGSALADLLGGYTLWIIPTLIIKSLMGFIVGYMTFKTHKNLHHKLSIGFSLFWGCFIFMSYQMVHRLTLQEGLFSSTLSKMNADSEQLITGEGLVDLIQSTSNYLLIFLIGLPLLTLLLLFFQHFVQKSTIPIRITLSYIFSGTVMMIGYYFAYGLLVSNFYIPIFSVPSNMLQFIGGIVIASFMTPLMLLLKKNITAKQG